MAEPTAWDGEALVAGEFLSLLGAVRESTTPELVGRISRLVGEGLEALSLLADPQMKELLWELRAKGPALKDLLQTVTAWQEDGLLEALGDMGKLAMALRESTTPALAARLAQQGVDLLDAARVIERLKDEVPRFQEMAAEALAEARADARPVGVGGLLRLLRDPDVQLGLKFMVNLSRRIFREMEDR
ncbi:MAG: DUF1641 domain-containing protein [Clostridiales bacterium]|nr:DUF1641 domain-containing protein [Clostridiales bacterium]